MKYIVFFTAGHNGDIIHNKAFIKDISENINVKCLYHYRSSSSLIEDLNVSYTQIYPHDHYELFSEVNSILYINLWLFPYILKNDEYKKSGVTLKTNYKIFEKIYQKINLHFNTNLKLKPIEQYLPCIDFSKVNCSTVENYIQKDKSKKVLFSNGPCLSGQSIHNGDMSEFIIELANQYKNITFIATQKFNSTLDNIKFTDDITQIKGCDLNQIGYLSTFCNLIIGKNSGPFCFSTISQNLNDPDKTFYVFGHNPNDWFCTGIEIKANHIFQTSNEIQDLYKDIKNLVSILESDSEVN
jgi:hypothetical protein